MAGFKLNLNKIEEITSKSNFYLLVLLILTIITYWPTVHHGFFIWDDNVVALSPEVQNFSLPGIKKIFTTFQVGLYHPITSLSFMLDFAIGKGSPLFFHITNLILHLLNVIILFLFLKKNFANPVVAFIATFIFVVHPINVETVAWVSARKDLISTFFMLLSLLYYTKHCRKVISLKHYIILILLISLSVFSKIQTVIIPIIFLLIDYHNERKFNVEILKEKIPLLIPIILAGSINVIAQKDYGYLSYGSNYPFFEKIFLYIYAFSQYLFNTFVPVKLSVFYPYPFKPSGEIILTDYIISSIFIFCCILLFVNKIWRNRSLFFGVLWFFSAISIVIFVSWNREFIITDRYSYFASIGLYIFCAFLISKWREQKKFVSTLSYTILSVYALFFFFISIQRVSLWKSSELLFKDASIKYMYSDILLNSLAAEEIKNGKFAEALGHLDQAIAISPDFVDAIYNKGVAYEKANDFIRAIDSYTYLIKMDRTNTKGWFARGSLYLKTGQYSKAIHDFTETIKINPKDFGALQNRAFVFLKVSEYRRALIDINMALKVDSRNGSTYYLRGLARIMLMEGGCEDIEKSILMGYKPAQKAKQQYCQ
jgi:protein O-mannosyl-transferase